MSVTLWWKRVVQFVWDCALVIIFDGIGGLLYLTMRLEPLFAALRRMG